MTASASNSKDQASTSVNNGGNASTTPASTDLNDKKATPTSSDSLLKPASNPLKRAPSLSELVDNFRTHHPDKWEKLSSTTTATGPEIIPPKDDGNVQTQPEASKNATTDTNPASSLEGPRLRLPARLGSAAPMMARSQSSNAIVQSSASTSAVALAATGPTAVNAGPTMMDRRPSVQAGMPTLEELNKRFALKQKEAAASKGIEPAGQTLGVPPTSSAMSRSRSDGSSSTTTTTTISSVGLASRSTSYTSVSSQDSHKENVNPVTAAKVDSTKLAVFTAAPPSSDKQQKQAPLIRSPTTPTDQSSSSPTSVLSEQEHPLEHSWTMYYDSKATALAARAKAKAQPSTSQNASWEASLSEIGTFTTVQSFCRLFNWLKKPSKMGQHENLHFFKDGIRPMWEDQANMKGGKWTLTLDYAAKDQIDRVWMWLCLALIGEDFDGREDSICGAVLSTRPRIYRLQVWVREKEDILSVNSIGKRLIQLLELDPDSVPTSPTSGSMKQAGVALEFGYHTKGAPPANKFISIMSTTAVASPAPNTGNAFGSFGSVQSNMNPNGGSKQILGPTQNSSASHFNRPGTFGGQGMTRAATMGSIASFANNGNGNGNGKENAFGKSMEKGNGMTPSVSWRERLGQTGAKKQAV